MAHVLVLRYVGRSRARQETHGALLECSLATPDRHTVFGRAEMGRLPAHNLHAHE